MARFPKVQSPCPYKGDLAAIMDGDQCRLCKRTVVDLDALGDQARIGFLSGCEEEVCVSYRLPAALAAAALAAAALTTPTLAAAQELPPEVAEEVIFMGGITDFDAIEYYDAADDAETPELPVVIEGEGEAQKS